MTEPDVLGSEPAAADAPPPGAAQPGVWARGVRRSFGPVHAVQGVDLDAPPGQVTALVGPNGSGKTTLL
ncbi:MAG TPA: ATP-binding cassette domain-containing protein, partial [Mycobacteriales bacterium]|nr:ATP-binding cassette domain-containing protein [Mycobacteriales bacterium]